MNFFCFFSPEFTYCVIRKPFTMSHCLVYPFIKIPCLELSSSNFTLKDAQFSHEVHSTKNRHSPYAFLLVFPLQKQVFKCSFFLIVRVFKIFIYLFWLHRVLVAACMWDLVPRPRIEPRHPALGVESLTH